MHTPIKISALTIYPVKSLAGIDVDEAILTRKGLALNCLPKGLPEDSLVGDRLVGDKLIGDRLWMVVLPNGRFVTQRQIPKMALIRTALDQNKLSLSTKGYESISIPFNHPLSVSRTVTVWKDPCEALDEGDEVSQWLTTVLDSQYPLHLVRMKPQFQRPQSKPDLLGKQTSTYFADAAPYLIANPASVDTLNQHLHVRKYPAVDMRRFRPNIVVNGLAAFDEHKVKRYDQPDGVFAFESCYPSERCVMITIDQDTGTKNPDMEPFKTLKILNPMPTNPSAPAFADNTVLAKGEGQIIRVGDCLNAVKTN